MPVSPEFGLQRLSADREGVTVLAASGDIDMTASREFGRRLESAIRSCEGNVVLDLRDVVHFDSTALRFLLVSRGLAEERGSHLVLVCSQRPVRRVLEVTGIADLFEVHSDRQAALESIGRTSNPKR